MAEHPGVTFKDGPTGRRAALVIGPDVWEIIKAAGDVEERGDEALSVVAELLNLPVARVRVALRYYAAYPDEIDAEVALADEESRAAEEGWRTQQRLLA
jgi:hypothetical protein